MLLNSSLLATPHLRIPPSPSIVCTRTTAAHPDYLHASELVICKQVPRSRGSSQPTAQYPQTDSSSYTAMDSQPGSAYTSENSPPYTSEAPPPQSFQSDASGAFTQTDASTHFNSDPSGQSYPYPANYSFSPPLEGVTQGSHPVLQSMGSFDMIDESTVNVELDLPIRGEGHIVSFQFDINQDDPIAVADELCETYDALDQRVSERGWSSRTP